MELNNDSSSSHKKDKDKSKHSSSSSTKELNNKKKSSHTKSQHHYDDDDEVSDEGELVIPSKRRHSSDEEIVDEDKLKKDSKKSHKSKKSHRSDEKSSSGSSSKKSKSDDKEREKESSKRSSKSEKSEKNSTKYEDKSMVENGGGAASSSGGGGDASLSIEETNKLRAKLGLKPLSVSDNKQADSKTSASDEKNDGAKKKYIDKDTNQEFEHMPAENMAEKKELKSFKEKLEEQKEKRKLLEKLSKTKSIGNDLDEEDVDSAQAWLKKLKQKEEANKKAKLLEEMDEQFGISDIVEEDTKKKVVKSKKDYTANQLKGLKVEHDESVFQEGKEIILTLKDRNILKSQGGDLDVDDDDEADVLVNVNIVDDEKAAKNVENKKKQTDYKPYDDFDDEGNFRERTILDKYNEELDGIRKKSFKLGKQGEYDTSDSNLIARLNEEHKSRAVKLDILNELKLANDYFTPQELEKFKKPKKNRKGMRKNKSLKADDLLPLPEQNVNNKNNDVGNSIKGEPLISRRAIESNGSKSVSLKDIDFGFKNSDSEDGELDDEDSDKDNSDDDFDVEKLKKLEEEKEIVEEENRALEELHNVLSKARNKSIFTKTSLPSSLIKEEEIKKETNGVGIDFDKIAVNEEEKMEANDPENKASLTMDTMSEFCRNLGSTSNDARRNRSLNNDDDDDEEEDKIQNMKLKNGHKSKNKMDTDDEDEDDKNENGTNSSSEDEDMEKTSIKDSDDEDNRILEDEPTIDRGLASCLKLAVNKGYLAHEKEKKNAKVTKAPIEAINFTIEEKNYYDIDDKYNRNRDRFCGPLTDFDEKSNYKPEVKIDYIDEKGHNMNEKEAFRYLSHRFHGKGSGKKKTEKRYKKLKEIESMKKMSSIDTPLNTVALLVEKQKRLQQPFVVLSTAKGKQDQVTLHKR